MSLQTISLVRHQWIWARKFLYTNRSNFIGWRRCHQPDKLWLTGRTNVRDVSGVWCRTVFKYWPSKGWRNKSSCFLEQFIVLLYQVEITSLLMSQTPVNVLHCMSVYLFTQQLQQLHRLPRRVSVAMDVLVNRQFPLLSPQHRSPQYRGTQINMS